MHSPPLGELYDLLRADGFSIGVADHVRIGRLLAQDAEWTLETLRISVAALVLTSPDQRLAFDACWERWAHSITPAPRATEIVRLPPPPPRPNHRRRLIRVGGAIAIVLAVGLAAMRWCDERKASPVAPETKNVAPSEVAADPIDLPAELAPPPRPAIGLTLAGLALGATLIVGAAVVAAVRARQRRRFLPGPWRYSPVLPPTNEPVLPWTAIEDAADELTWQAPDTWRGLDIARSVGATVERGGLPTMVHRKAVVMPCYVVLEDRAGSADCWKHLYDELLRGLVREGVELERYTFATSPEHCTGLDGQIIGLDELLDRCDALIAIGDGEGAVNPVTGDRARWLASLRRVGRRLWINPIPPARWTASARAIAAEMPMEHGVARALAALHAGVDRIGRLEAPFPAVIERAPGTASAVAALRVALGHRGFLVVASVSVIGAPTIAAARWLAAAHELELDEQGWLSVATLPWFRTEQWPEGLRDRLSEALAATAPDLARAVALTAEGLLAASEPPLNSGAHVTWQLESAYRAGRRGERRDAARTLSRIAATPLADQARGLRVALGLPDRARRALASAMVVGMVLVVVSAVSDVVATRAWRAEVARREVELQLFKRSAKYAIAKFTAFRDQMCRCADKACADKVTEQITKWGEEMAKEGGDRAATVSEDDTKKIAAVTEKMTECMTKAMTAGMTPPPPEPAAGSN